MALTADLLIVISMISSIFMCHSIIPFCIFTLILPAIGYGITFVLPIAFMIDPSLLMKLWKDYSNLELIARQSNVHFMGVC